MTPADRAPATPSPQPDVERIVAAALAEDAPWGDVSSEA
ncbi:nicotinate-nucleotide diphosphorylase (carboxylating), partial [Xanthomonas citri pv. citri]|nr:nicotinate-nucleotide diphosphorylase (carboxylating) [Xanthomonas citri pv. citri]